MTARVLGKIDVRIDRLVLHGFGDAQRTEIAAQLQAELSRLLADPVAAAEIARSRHVPALRIPAAPAAPAASAGAHAAESIVRELRR